MLYLDAYGLAYQPQSAYSTGLTEVSRSIKPWSDTGRGQSNIRFSLGKSTTLTDIKI